MSNTMDEPTEVYLAVSNSDVTLDQLNGVFTDRFLAEQHGFVIPLKLFTRPPKEAPYYIFSVMLYDGKQMGAINEYNSSSTEVDPLFGQPVAYCQVNSGCMVHASGYDRAATREAFYKLLHETINHKENSDG